jgi:LPS export ABC transporter protein LptC
MKAIRLACGLIFTMMLVACQQISTTPSEITNADMQADAVAYGVKHVMTRNGVRVSELRADTAFQASTGHSMNLQGVRLTFFTENGIEGGNLTSRAGEYNLETGQFTALGDVVLVTTGPTGTRRLQSELLNYDLKTDEIWTDSRFTLTEGSRVTRGTSFRSDGKFENWTVRNAETEGGLPIEGTGFSC